MVIFLNSKRPKQSSTSTVYCMVAGGWLRNVVKIQQGAPGQDISVIQRKYTVGYSFHVAANVL